MAITFLFSSATVQFSGPGYVIRLVLLPASWFLASKILSIRSDKYPSAPSEEKEAPPLVSQVLADLAKCRAFSKNIFSQNPYAQADNYLSTYFLFSFCLQARGVDPVLLDLFTSQYRRDMLPFLAARCRLPISEINKLYHDRADAYSVVGHGLNRMLDLSSYLNDISMETKNFVACEIAADRFVSSAELESTDFSPRLAASGAQNLQHISSSINKCYAAFLRILRKRLIRNRLGGYGASLQSAKKGKILLTILLIAAVAVGLLLGIFFSRHIGDQSSRSPSPVPSSTPVFSSARPAPSPVPSAVPSSTPVISAPVSNGPRMYYRNNSDTYHASKECDAIAGLGSFYFGSVQYVEKMGLKPCPLCIPTPAP